MLELKITVQLLDSAEKDIIGIKEALAYMFEKKEWADVIKFEIKTSEPLQLTLGEIRQTITKARALQELKAKNLTLPEMQNIVAALAELSKDAETQSL